MKKILLVILALLFVFSAACAAPAESVATMTPEATSAPTPEAIAIETSAPTEAPTAETTPEPPVELAGQLEVHFIDVGQADAELLICNGKTMLIDGGNAADSDVIYTVLEKQGIEHLDYVIGTHAHEDHIGGLSGALTACTASTVYIPVTGADSKAYNNFITKAKEAADTIATPAPGTTIDLGGATVEFLGPIDEDPDRINSTSICCKVVFGDTSFLFTGDAEEDAEHKMIDAGYDLSADVLKAPHHGSDTSSSYVFLREVMPKYVVIEVGKDNSYGHPSNDILSRYRDVGAQVFRTDMQGDILCVSDGTNITFTTAKNQDADTNPTLMDGSGQNSESSEIAEAVEPEEPEDEPEVDKSSGQYIGNVNTKKFHRPSCGSLPDEKNRVYMDSRDEAIDNGYVPCKKCKP